MRVNGLSYLSVKLEETKDEVSLSPILGSGIETLLSTESRVFVLERFGEAPLKGRE